VFLGLQTPPWVFIGAMVGVALYNASILVRAARKSRATPSP
jgi:hypothetical protein